MASIFTFSMIRELFSYSRKSTTSAAALKNVKHMLACAILFTLAEVSVSFLSSMDKIKNEQRNKFSTEHILPENYTNLEQSNKILNLLYN